MKSQSAFNDALPSLDRPCIVRLGGSLDIISFVPFFFLLLLRPSVLVNFPQLDIIQALCVYFTAGLSGGFDNGSQATGRDRHFSQVEPDLGDEPSPSFEQLDYLAPSVPRV